MIKFDATKEDAAIITNIVQRAAKLFAEHGGKVDRLSLTMDVTATHLNGCPLKLADLLAADDFNFMHDVSGIRRHIDRDSGALTDCFLPRFAQPCREVADDDLMKPFIHPTDYRRGRTDYEAIRDEANDPQTLAVEVTEEEHDEMLGCVPPIYVAGGFLVGEALTGDERGTVYAHYAERDGRFYARYAVHGRDDTLIPAVLSPVEAA